MVESTTEVKTKHILHHEEEVMGTIVTFDLYDDGAPSKDLERVLGESTVRSLVCAEARSHSSSALIRSAKSWSSAGWPVPSPTAGSTHG
jgi:hypothetical protein